MTKTVLASVSWSILCIAVAVYAQGPKEQVPSVRSILVRAKESGTNIPDKKTRDLFLRDFAITVGEIGDLEPVHEIIREFPEKRDQNRALLQIVQEQAEAGNVHAAFSLTTTFETPAMRDSALQRIAFAQAKAGDIEESQKTAARLSVQSGRDQTIVDIVKILVKAGDILNARKTAALIPGEIDRAVAGSEIARDQARKGTYRELCKPPISFRAAGSEITFS